MSTEEEIQEVYELPLKQNRSGQFEYTLPKELAEHHDLPTSVEYTIGTKWGDEGRETSLVYSVHSSGENKTNTRSVIHHPNGATVRIPNAFVVERGLDKRLEVDDDPMLFAFSPEKGHLDIVPDTPFEIIDMLETIDQVMSKEDGFSPKQDGWNREHTGFRFVIPSQYNRHYDLDTRGYGKWSLAIFNGQPALTLTFLEDDEEAYADNPVVTRWQNYEAGDIEDGEAHYLTSQVQLMVPRVFVRALGWEGQPLAIYPEADRIVIAPDSGGTPVDK